MPLGVLEETEQTALSIGQANESESRGATCAEPGFRASTLAVLRQTVVEVAADGDGVAIRLAD